MRKFSFVLAMLAVVLALGLAFVGCENDTTGGGRGSVNSALNGSWRANRADDDQVIRFNNGSFSFIGDGVESQRGSYTTSGGAITITMTELYMDADTAYQLNTSPGWKSMNQYLTLYTAFIDQLPISQAEKDQYIAEMEASFAPMQYSYSINGNTLTVIGVDGQPYTYTRIG